VKEAALQDRGTAVRKKAGQAWHMTDSELAETRRADRC